MMVTTTEEAKRPPLLFFGRPRFGKGRCGTGVNENLTYPQSDQSEYAKPPSNAEKDLNRKKMGKLGQACSVGCWLTLDLVMPKRVQSTVRRINSPPKHKSPPSFAIFDLTSVTPISMTSLLRGCGVLEKDVEVRKLEMRRLGKRKSAAIVAVRYSSDTEKAPGTFVLKCAPLSFSTRLTSKIWGNFELEARMFLELGIELAQLGLKLPHCFFSAYDPLGPRICLLLEDISPSGLLLNRGLSYEAGADAGIPDQVDGVPLGACLSALRSVAVLHAAYWGCDKSDQLKWIPSVQTGARMPSGLFAKAIPRFAAKYKELLGWELSTARLELLHRLKNGLPTYANEANDWILNYKRRFTIVHGDYQRDSLMYLKRQDAVGTLEPDQYFCDLQFVKLGKGELDVSWFLSKSATVDVIVRHLPEALRAYHTALLASPTGRVPKEYSFQECVFNFFASVVFHGLVASCVRVSELDLKDRRSVLIAKAALVREDALLDCFDAVKTVDLVLEQQTFKDGVFDDSALSRILCCDSEFKF